MGPRNLDEKYIVPGISVAVELHVDEALPSGHECELDLILCLLQLKILRPDIGINDIFHLLDCHCLCCPSQSKLVIGLLVEVKATEFKSPK